MCRAWGDQPNPNRRDTLAFVVLDSRQVLGRSQEPAMRTASVSIWVWGGRRRWRFWTVGPPPVGDTSQYCARTYSTWSHCHVGPAARGRARWAGEKREGGSGSRSEAQFGSLFTLYLFLFHIFISHFNPKFDSEFQNIFEVPNRTLSMAMQV
jgi:hypothetical protein